MDLKLQPNEEQEHLIRLGRREGVAGSSKRWFIHEHGAWHPTDREILKARLRDGTLSGIEPVRREDGDWGPLFGRPLYREVFEGTDEPRDHAKERARVGIERHRQRMRLAVVVAIATWVASVVMTASALPPIVGQALLLATGCAGILGGVQLLRANMAQRELDQLVEALVPPVLEPPKPVDWQKLAADDEVAAAGRPSS